ncbi:unnamed protein product [Sphacelaria rigidula]
MVAIGLHLKQYITRLFQLLKHILFKVQTVVGLTAAFIWARVYRFQFHEVNLVSAPVFCDFFFARYFQSRSPVDLVFWGKTLSRRNQTHLAPRSTWTHSSCCCPPRIISQIEAWSEDAQRAAA